MTNWIVFSKLKTLMEQVREVPRVGVMSLVGEVLDSRLTLVHAPARYEKTTCLGMFQG